MRSVSRGTHSLAANISANIHRRDVLFVPTGSQEAGLPKRRNLFERKLLPSAARAP